MSEQLHHYNNRFKKNQFPIILVCDQVTSPANIGSIFRIAEGLGIEKIYFCGSEVSVVSKRMQRTARATYNHVAYEQRDDCEEIVKELLADKYTLIALEITNTSIPISTFDFKKYDHIALVIGEENFGVSKEVLALVKESVHINMFGINSSLNVATATSIALYEITKQLSETL